MANHRPKRVLLVDDHPVFRFGLKALLDTLPDLEVIGEVEEGEAAQRAAQELSPDIILMDVNMPGLNGIEATRRILQADPQIAILVVTMFDNDAVFDAMQAGARGYLLKGAHPEETIRAIQAVANGESIFSPKVAERLIGYFAQRSAGTFAGVFPGLTDREREILALLAKGLTNQAIAERLYLSVKTVRNLASSIYSKLQVVDREEAIQRAREAGF